MNKRRHLNCNLNTINIAYTRKQEHFQHQNPFIRPPSDLQRPRHRQNHHESQERVDRQPEFDQRDTIQNSNHSSPDKYDSSFNDTKLKYEKSQTAKESYFNRMRIHIYRKEKRSKWVDLASSINAVINKQKQIYPSVETPYSIRKQNKTALPRKRQVELANNPRIKTHSSEEDKKASSSRVEELLTTMLQPERDLKQKEQQKSFRFTRLDDLFHEVRFNPEAKPKPYSTYQKYRNLSENTTQLQKRLAKLDIRKMRHPSNLQPPKKQEQKQIKTIENQTIFSKDAGFEAWEDVDIFSTNRNGIVEYTKQQQVKQVNVEKRTDSRRSHKKKNTKIFKQ